MPGNVLLADSLHQLQRVEALDDVVPLRLGRPQARRRRGDGTLAGLSHDKRRDERALAHMPSGEGSGANGSGDTWGRHRPLDLHERERDRSGDGSALQLGGPVMGYQLCGLVPQKVVGQAGQVVNSGVLTLLEGAAGNTARLLYS